jgi:hypothetical protein
MVLRTDRQHPAGQLGALLELGLGLVDRGLAFQNADGFEAVGVRGDGERERAQEGGQPAEREEAFRCGHVASPLARPRAGRGRVSVRPLRLK